MVDFYIGLATGLIIFFSTTGFMSIAYKIGLKERDENKR